MSDIGDFLAAVHWGRVAVALVATLIAVVAGIWFPAKMLEHYTNQPLVRWAWYVAGTLALLMVFVSMYGYGHFWTSYADSEEVRQAAPANRPDGG